MKEMVSKETQKETHNHKDHTHNDIHNWGFRMAARIIHVEVTGVGGHWKRGGIHKCD